MVFKEEDPNALKPLQKIIYIPTTVEKEEKSKKECRFLYFAAIIGKKICVLIYLE